MDITFALQDIAAQNHDLSRTLDRWLLDAKCIDRDIDNPLLTDIVVTIIDSIHHEMVTGERRNILAVSTLTDPYILEQAYDADEATLTDDDAYCPDCDQAPCRCTESHCQECGNLDEECICEPPEASEVTGYDNGPTYW
jgi:hypothetical protein